MGKTWYTINLTVPQVSACRGGMDYHSQPSPDEWFTLNIKLVYGVVLPTLSIFGPESQRECKMIIHVNPYVVMP